VKYRKYCLSIFLWWMSGNRSCQFFCKCNRISFYSVKLNEIRKQKTSQHKVVMQLAKPISERSVLPQTCGPTVRGTGFTAFKDRPKHPS